MKKIYSSAIGLLFCGSMIAQTALTPRVSTHAAQMPANAKPSFSVSSSPSRTLGPKYWVEPVGDVMNAMGYDLTGASTGQSQGHFLTGIFQDSTVTISDPSGTDFMSTILIGSVLDPKSSNLTTDFTPILTSSEGYSIDSLQIIGSYTQVDASVVDTLYTWLVWGDTANTSVFSKRATTSIWVSPISTWRPYILGPKVTGATGAAGNKVKASAPAANMKLIKYALTADDVAQGAGFSNVISIALPTPANIPAGNVVSCFYTFVPGGAYTTGDCAYSFDGAPTAQTVNGFAAMIWNQTSPTVAAVSDYQNQQVDMDGYNMGTTYSAKQRHLVYPATYDNSLFGDLVTAPLIFYSIYSNTSVGVHENTANDLISVYPNPSTGIINVNTGMASKSVVEVYNVVGALVLSKEFTGATTNTLDLSSFGKGVYTVKVTTNNTVSVKKVSITK